MRHHITRAARQAHPYRHLIAVAGLILALGGGIAVYEAVTAPHAVACQNGPC